jgi:hypothetical protein
MFETTKSEEQVRKRFEKYLNGPMGKTVLKNLEEGESFILQASENTMRVTKKKGRAVVVMLPKIR